MQICLVDGLPRPVRIWKSLRSALRKRLEALWVARLQAACPDCGPYYAYLREAKSKDEQRRNLVAHLKRRARGEKNVQANGIISAANNFLMADGLIYRRVRKGAGEELRVFAPRGSIKSAFAIYKFVEVPLRKELLMHYHSGILANHVGPVVTKVAGIPGHAVFLSFVLDSDCSDSNEIQSNVLFFVHGTPSP